MENRIHPKRLLLVDDDDLSREVLTIQIAAEGYLVETATSGDAAWSRLAQPALRWPDALLIDLQMEGTSGAELGRRVRSVPRSPAEPQIVLLAMSASEPTEDLTPVFDGFLLKPFLIAQLVDALMLSGPYPPASATAPAPATCADPNTWPAEAGIDASIYRKLAASMPADRLQQLYTLCIDDAEARIGRMRLASTSGNNAAYCEQAHAIKGGSSMVGAVELARLAARAEETGIEAANHVASFNELLQACDQLRRILVGQVNQINT